MGSNHTQEQSRLKMEELKNHKKYSNDPISFIKEQVAENFKLFDFEKNIIKLIDENKFNIIKKSRQMNLTSISAAYCAWSMIFKTEYNITIISPRISQSIEFTEKVKKILNNYYNNNSYFNCEFLRNNKTEISLSNGCNIRAASSSANALVGYRIDMLIFDEAAFVNNFDYIFKHIAPMIEQIVNSKLIIISTPNRKNYFHKLWKGAVDGVNNFKTTHVDWTMNPNLNKNMIEVDGKMTNKWYEDMCKTLGYNEDMILQELWGEFSESKMKSKMISFRVSSKISKKMEEKLKLKNLKASEYIRKLIENDLK